MTLNLTFEEQNDRGNLSVLFKPRLLLKYSNYIPIVIRTSTYSPALEIKPYFRNLEGVQI